MPSERDSRRERELLDGVASGRAQALAELYDRLAAALFRHALALTRHRADAEDLVHAVFVKLATTGAELLGVREPASYLHRTLRTTWIDTQRRRATSERIVEQVAWVQPLEGRLDDVIDVAGALEGLPPMEREVIVLHCVEGFSFREIGRMTGVSLFTAAGRYRVGIRRMRGSLTRAREKDGTS